MTQEKRFLGEPSAFLADQLTAALVGAHPQGVAALNPLRAFALLTHFAKSLNEPLSHHYNHLKKNFLSN
jgi:hypothetical protein